MIVDKSLLKNRGPNAPYYGPIGIAPFQIDKGRKFSDDQGNAWEAGETIPANHMALIDRSTGKLVPLTYERMDQLGWEDKKDD